MKNCVSMSPAAKVLAEAIVFNDFRGSHYTTFKEFWEKHWEEYSELMSDDGWCDLSEALEPYRGIAQ